MWLRIIRGGAMSGDAQKIMIAVQRRHRRTWSEA
ncbi:hypothetical protein CM00_gp61 [Mycobacterium phage Kugel]|uniref:Uncharacterized protein n=1 Tax=Mycobacterium phage Kugel TaxID=2923003 RepID=G8IB99_9CAUD|nr:hypothetical protein CM00_gp61 [Mycobacterium phage Kugel]AER49992.1 hypothetical protein KUGEL_61 [Mycobacterium phage Kugel]